MFIELQRRASRLVGTHAVLLDAFVVVVNRHRDGLLRPILTDDVLVQIATDLDGLGNT